MTTTLNTKGTRRAKGGARSISREARQAGGSRPRQRGDATTDHQAVMTGHTVRILADYDGLKGCFGTVIQGDFGDGKVLVAVTTVTNQCREICFLSREVETVAMNDTLTHTGQLMTTDNEVYLLIRRCTDLRMIARWSEVSAALQARLEKRAQRLHDEIRALQRAAAVRRAHALVRALGQPFCTALVVWEGGAR